jgi:DNA uptake protein ComE-like DNA-binding protein
VRAAERIVAHRDQHGPFPSLDALEAVEGFDQHRVARLARRATVKS